MSRYYFFCIGLALVFITSCKKLPIASSTIPVDSVDIELERFQVNEINFEYIHFKSKVEYVSRLESQNFTINGRMKKDSIIWLSITPGLGIEALRCLIVKDSILILDRIHNKLNAFDYGYLKSMLNAELTFDNIQSLLLGNLVYPKKSKDKLQKLEGDGIYQLTQNRSSLKIDNFVSTLTYKITNLTILNVQDTSLIEVKYSNFIPLDTFLLANTINGVVKFKDANGRENTTFMNINHTKAEIVTKPLNFPFNVPKRFEDK